MTLKCKTETVHTVELNDLEQFILEKTGHTYEIAPNEEWSNDQQHRFEITGYLHSYQNTDWNLFKVSGMQGQYQLRGPQAGNHNRLRGCVERLRFKRRSRSDV